jgi:hypothetical protein
MTIPLRTSEQPSLIVHSTTGPASVWNAATHSPIDRSAQEGIDFTTTFPETWVDEQGVEHEYADSDPVTFGIVSVIRFVVSGNYQFTAASPVETGPADEWTGLKWRPAQLGFIPGGIASMAVDGILGQGFLKDAGKINGNPTTTHYIPAETVRTVVGGPITLTLAEAVTGRAPPGCWVSDIKQGIEVIEASENP